MDATETLQKLRLPRLYWYLQPKEALAMLNGTSACTAIAANCIYEAHKLLGLALHAHALMLQGLYATDLSFHAFIYQHKPHPGKIWAATCLRDLNKLLI